jgi:hypothetical protein
MVATQKLSSNTGMQSAKPRQITRLMPPSPSTSCRRHVSQRATSACLERCQKFLRSMKLIAAAKEKESKRKNCAQEKTNRHRVGSKGK